MDFFKENAQAGIFSAAAAAAIPSYARVSLYQFFDHVNFQWAGVLSDWRLADSWNGPIAFDFARTGGRVAAAGCLDAPLHARLHCPSQSRPPSTSSSAQQQQETRSSS